MPQPLATTALRGLTTLRHRLRGALNLCNDSKVVFIVHWQRRGDDMCNSDKRPVVHN
jgi:hypothetical protein